MNDHCTYCGAKTHTVKNCPKTWDGSINRARLRCAYCGASDHNIQACPKNANAANRRALSDHFVLD